MRVVMFASYKGGAGRTSLCVSSAIKFAAQGKRVLIIDLDIDAPGIQYFPNFIESYQDLMSTDSSGKKIKGIMGWLQEAINTKTDIKLENIPIEPYIISVDINNLPKNSTVDFIAAGINSDKYHVQDSTAIIRDLNDSNDKRLYAKLLIESIKISNNKYDYVMVDSKAGISGTTFFSANYLADICVLISNASTQSLEGVINLSANMPNKITSILCISPMMNDDNEISVSILNKINKFLKSAYKLLDCNIFNSEAYSSEEELNRIVLVPFIREYLIGEWHVDPIDRGSTYISQIEYLNNLVNILSKSKEYAYFRRELARLWISAKIDYIHSKINEYLDIHWKNIHIFTYAINQLLIMHKYEEACDIINTRRGYYCKIEEYKEEFIWITNKAYFAAARHYDAANKLDKRNKMYKKIIKKVNTIDEKTSYNAKYIPELIKAKILKGDYSSAKRSANNIERMYSINENIERKASYIDYINTLGREWQYDAEEIIKYFKEFSSDFVCKRDMDNIKTDEHMSYSWSAWVQDLRYEDPARSKIESFIDNIIYLLERNLKNTKIRYIVSADSRPQNIIERIYKECRRRLNKNISERLEEVLIFKLLYRHEMANWHEGDLYLYEFPSGYHPAYLNNKEVNSIVVKGRPWFLGTLIDNVDWVVGYMEDNHGEGYTPNTFREKYESYWIKGSVVTGDYL